MIIFVGHNRRLWTITIWICMTTALPFYCSMFFPNTAQNVIEEFLKNSAFGFGAHSSNVELQLSFLWAAFLCLMYLGVVLGMIYAPTVADRIGRKWTLSVAALIELPAHVCLVIAQPCNAWYLLFVGRFVAGIGFGLSTIAACVFLSEISPARLRGKLITVFPVGLGIGAILGAVLGLMDVLGTPFEWPYAYIVPMVFCVCILPLLQKIPDSPQYLGAVAAGSRDYNAAARAEDSLRYYHGDTEDLDLIYSNILNDGGKYSASLRAVFRLLRTNILRKPLKMTSIVAATCCFSGIMIILTYSTAIFFHSNLKYVQAEYCAVGLKCVYLISYLVAMPLVDRFGRRPLLMISVWTTLVCWLLVCLLQYGSSSVRSISTVVLLYVAAFTINFGIRPVSFIIINELFPYQYRAAGNAWGGILEYCLHLLTVFMFWPLFVLMGNWVFVLFAIPLFGLGIFLQKKCPETKNRVPNEIYPELASMALNEEDTDFFMPQPMRFGADNVSLHEEDFFLLGGDKKPHYKSVQVF